MSILLDFTLVVLEVFRYNFSPNTLLLLALDILLDSHNKIIYINL